jgi:hypothetical protein
MTTCSRKVAARYLERSGAFKLTDATKWALTYILEHGHVIRNKVLSPAQAKQLVAAGLIVDSAAKPGRPNTVYLTPDGERLARTLS